MEKRLQEEFISILKEELVPAFGCTEPIALAYASARGREVLGCEPERIVAKCSGNMIKNVRCVTIPGSGGMTGIETACALGAVAGNPDAGMEVLGFSMLTNMCAGILDQPLSGEEVNETAEARKGPFSELVLKCLEKM